jgi:hypothetical protein
MLKAFKEAIDKSAGPDAAAATAATASSSEVTVFVADVPDTLATFRKRLVSELQRNKVTVATGFPPPYDRDGHDKRVKEAVQDAHLSVHLLDELPGREIDGLAEETYPLRQLELARGHAREQLIWVKSELDSTRIEDERYRTLLDNLEHGSREGARYNFVRGSSSRLVPEIVEKLEQLRKAPGDPGAPRRGVLLDTHLKDQLYAMDLGRLLLTKSIQPYINPQEDDPPRTSTLSRASCVRCRR